HAWRYTHAHTHTHTNMHAHAQAQRNIHSHTQTHTHTHTYTHTHTTRHTGHAHTNTHRHADHAHTHLLVYTLVLRPSSPRLRLHTHQTPHLSIDGCDRAVRIRMDRHISECNPPGVGHG